jgi:hypothetical protein
MYLYHFIHKILSLSEIIYKLTTSAVLVVEVKVVDDDTTAAIDGFAVEIVLIVDAEVILFSKLVLVLVAETIDVGVDLSTFFAMVSSADAPELIDDAGIVGWGNSYKFTFITGNYLQ